MVDVSQEGKAEQTLRTDARSTRSLVIVFTVIYAIILLVLCMVYRLLPGPEFVVLCFFIYAAYNRKTQRFVKDWIPIITLFLSYIVTNGIVGSIPRDIHVIEPINAELQLFGTIPTLVLQEFYRSYFLDVLGTLFYSMHFIAPIVFAFVLWKFHSKSYWKYTLGLAICTYGALVTFLVYPVAPPWYGVGATRILLQVDSDLGVPVYHTILDFVQENPFAAFPSLHAAYPWLISLFALKIKKAKALPILIFPIGVWFSAVYLGEHYVVDIMGGIAYATISFILAEYIIPQLFSRYAHREWRKKEVAGDLSGDHKIPQPGL